ncbi:hypothetical protein [Lentibacillus daqui]|nr:hypothetical protein [Lentibacillus daqui]
MHDKRNDHRKNRLLDFILAFQDKNLYNDKNNIISDEKGVVPLIR